MPPKKHKRNRERSDRLRAIAARIIWAFTRRLPLPLASGLVMILLLFTAYGSYRAHARGGRARARTHRVRARAHARADACGLRAGSGVDRPRTLNRDQAGLLQTSAEPCQTDRKLIELNGAYSVDLTVPGNHLMMLEITPVSDETSAYPGIDPNQFMGME